MERYKQLLLKQRDIMIALTQRLNERDEQILALQAELEAYDTHQKWVKAAPAPAQHAETMRPRAHARAGGPSPARPSSRVRQLLCLPASPPPPPPVRVAGSWRTRWTRRRRS